MASLVEPLTTAIKGKGPAALLKQVGKIIRRFGLTVAKADRPLRRLSQILQQFDCPATLPITAVVLARNSTVIGEYADQGIEFAVHGYRHIDYSQRSLEEQVADFQRACRVFDDHGMHFEGFRCPYLRWNDDTLTALGQTGFAYDSSSSLVWDVDEKHVTPRYRRVLGFYGSQPAADSPALPYLDTANDLVRIPYCLPDDEALVERLEWDSPAEMDQVWPEMLRQTHKRGELLTLGLHPDRTEFCSNALIATLEQALALTPAVWCARLSDIALWWRGLCDATVQVRSVGQDALELIPDGPEGTTLLLRSLDVRTAASPWAGGYQRATQAPCVIHTRKRPFIGVSPGSSSILLSFLRQQGYIVEVSSQPDAYTFYIERSSFSRREERPLLDHIEEADFPLARLNRWPNGARGALAVTGDIDVLTLWDYGLRFFGR